MFFFGVGQQCKVFCFIIKLLFADNAVFDKQDNVGQFFFLGFTVFFEQLVQLIGHFTGDVAVDLFHVAVGL